MPKQKGRSTYTRHIGAFGLKSAKSVLFLTGDINYLATDADGLTATSTRTVLIKPFPSVAVTTTATIFTN
jgi:hypothetical protein